DPRWARWEIVSTTPCARVSLPLSNASCSTVSASKPRPRRAWRSSTSSKGGTTPIVVTPRSTISRPSLMNERTLHNLAHGAATNRKKIPHRHRERRIKQEKNKRQSTQAVLEHQPINYQAQHSLLKP